MIHLFILVVCALDASGQMSCFAYENVDGRASPIAAPGLAFAQLAAGDRNTVSSSRFA